MNFEKTNKKILSGKIIVRERLVGKPKPDVYQSAQDVPKLSSHTYACSPAVLLCKPGPIQWAAVAAITTEWWLRCQALVSAELVLDRDPTVD